MCPFFGGARKGIPSPKLELAQEFVFSANWCPKNVRKDVAPGASSAAAMLMATKVAAAAAALPDATVAGILATAAGILVPQWHWSPKKHNIVGYRCGTES